LSEKDSPIEDRVVNRDETVAGTAEDRATGGAPRPLNRWRIVVVGRAKAALVKERSDDLPASVTPYRRPEVSRESERSAAPAA
jgi:hypothetical protein